MRKGSGGLWPPAPLRIGVQGVGTARLPPRRTAMTGRRLRRFPLAETPLMGKSVDSTWRAEILWRGFGTSWTKRETTSSEMRRRSCPSSIKWYSRSMINFFTIKRLQKLKPVVGSR